MFRLGHIHYSKLFQRSLQYGCRRQASKLDDEKKKKKKSNIHITFERRESNPGLPVCTLEYTQYTILGGVLYTTSDFWEREWVGVMSHAKDKSKLPRQCLNAESGFSSSQ
jgi:hypothetical protein